MPEVSHTPRAFFCPYAGTTPINNLQALPSDLAASASYSPTPRNKQQGLRRSLGIYRGIGAGCAALKAFAAASAQVAPLSRHLPRRRRRLRRFLGIYRDIGAGCAALKAFAATSAQVAPLSRHLPRHRRRLRRSLGICRGVGGSFRQSLGIYRGVGGSFRQSLGICRGR